MIRKLAPLVMALSLLSACDSGSNAPATTTKMKSVEVEPGTISDDMIILDSVSVDGTAVDNAVPVDPAAKKAAEKDGDTDNKADKPEADAKPDTTEPEPEPAETNSGE